jgi:AraC-like DNA-binding protein
MHEANFTKARSNGAIADALERAGGKIEHVFSRADLPLRLIDQPDVLVPLHDQVGVLEYASREIGDAALSARLASEAGFPGLGTYGKRVLTAPTLRAAIARASLLVGPLLCSATTLSLHVASPWARWSYDMADPADIGRQKHEILALAYMLDLLRRFAGPRWIPSQVEVAGPPVMGRVAVEDVLSCSLSRGEESAIIFPSDLLELPNIRAELPEHDDFPDDEAVLPDPGDLVKCVEHLISLALLEGRPRVEWVAGKLELSGRSLQRHLNAHNTTFEYVMDRVLVRHAISLLEQGDMPITEIAYQLGYSDPSHFVRAFRRWSGQTPGDFRRRMGITRRNVAA